MDEDRLDAAAASLKWAQESGADLVKVRWQELVQLIAGTSRGPLEGKQLSHCPNPVFFPCVGPGIVLRQRSIVRGHVESPLAGRVVLNTTRVKLRNCLTHTIGIRKSFFQLVEFEQEEMHVRIGALSPAQRLRAEGRNKSVDQAHGLELPVKHRSANFSCSPL